MNCTSTDERMSAVNLLYMSFMKEVWMLDRERVVGSYILGVRMAIAYPYAYFTLPSRYTIFYV